MENDPTVTGFEWNAEKARRNLLKHGVSFEEAATVFNDRNASTIFDPDHSEDEDRYLTMGVSRRMRIVMVAHTQRGNRIRIITARKAKPHETRSYGKT